MRQMFGANVSRVVPRLVCCSGKAEKEGLGSPKGGRRHTVAVICLGALEAWGCPAALGTRVLDGQATATETGARCKL